MNAAVDMFGHPVYTGERQENDYYPTPVQCIDPLLDHIKWQQVGSFLEPCRGQVRNIYDRVPLPEEQKRWAELSEGVNYLTTEFEPVDLIITNPPFGHGGRDQIAVDFMEKSLREAQCVCYLLPVNYMGAECRGAFWLANRPTHLFTFIERPSFNGQGQANAVYGWFCWDHDGLLTVPPGMYWL